MMHGQKNIKKDQSKFMRLQLLPRAHVCGTNWE